MSDYTTREMMEAFDQTPPVKTFLQKTFFPTEETHVSEKVEFDVRKGKRIMAPLVSPRMGGKVITRQGFRTNQFTTPKIAPERPMTIDDITQRAIGENIYSQRTPEEREDELLAKDWTDLEESIARRKEWMCRQILFEGKIDVEDEEEGLDVQIDFGFSNIIYLGADEKWSLASADPLKPLREIRRKIIKATGKAPDIAIFASDAIEDFVNNSYVMKAMNVLNMKNVVIEPRVVDPALTFYGRIAELDLDIYTYDEWFLNDEGDEEAMIPAGTAKDRLSMDLLPRWKIRNSSLTKESLFRRSTQTRRTKLRCYVLLLVHFLDLTTLIPGRLSTLTAQKQSRGRLYGIQNKNRGKNRRQEIPSWNNPSGRYFTA